MTGDASLLTGLVIKHGGFVTYGDNNRGRIIGCGDIGVKGNLMIQNALLVEGLKHNLQALANCVTRVCKSYFNQRYASYPVQISSKHTLLVKMLTMFTC